MGRVVGKSYARQPVNLGTWKPMISDICLHMEQKLLARLKSHLRCKISIIYMRNWSVFVYNFIMIQN